jgi:Uma2 family endonuclease
VEPRRRKIYTIEEYVHFEEQGALKHEFFDGQIFLMSGGTPEHAEMAGLVIISLGNQLKGRCRVFTADARIRVLATGLDTYPDASIVCGTVETDREDRNAITNPTVIVEITSKGTEKYDRGEKLEQYQRIPSVRDVVIVSHREPQIEVWHRDGDTWASTIARAGEAARIASVDATLAVDDIFRPAV